jgi:hypothetical protein
MSIREESEESTEQIKPRDHNHHHLAVEILVSKMDAISGRINDLTNAVAISTAKTERLADKIDKIQKTLLKR